MDISGDEGAEKDGEWRELNMFIENWTEGADTEQKEGLTEQDPREREWGTG